MLGDLEMAVMKEVWRRGKATVHDVRDALRPKRKLAYTTVMTTMSNLEKKGLLGHDVDGRTYVYHAKVDQKTVASSTVGEMLDKFFDGSVAQLVNTLFRQEDLSKAEFEKLRQEILAIRKQEGDHE